MPAARLAPSIRQDLSLDQTNEAATGAVSLSAPNTNGRSGYRSHPPPPIMTSTAPTTLRKSYRRILSLSPGLRVRMRTLFLPQLRDGIERGCAGDDDDSEGEPRIVLCVEIENPSEGVHLDGFEVEIIKVDVGGKGGKAVAELVCQPEQKLGVFPLKLRAMEQYNLLYAVTIALTPDAAGRGDEQRPVSITVVGRPYAGPKYPTATFDSRWNCTLDLAYFNASFNTSPQPMVPAQTRKRLSKPIAPPTSVIAGDKRYSIASLNSDLSDPRRQQAPNDFNARTVSFRGAAQTMSELSSGLLVSVKILPQSSEVGTTVRTLEPFSIEVFVHNRTEEVKRFRLSIPGREGSAGKVRETWEKRRRRRGDESDWGADDPGE